MYIYMKAAACCFVKFMYSIKDPDVVDCVERHGSMITSRSLVNFHEMDHWSKDAYHIMYTMFIYWY